MSRLSLTAVFALALCAGLLRAEDEKKPAELAKPDADGWIALFNGKDLTGWNGDPKVWRVENGYISGKADAVGGNTFLICPHKFTDFVFECKVQMIKAGKFPNSGVQYRSKVVNADKWVVHGYQADIGDGWWGALYEEGGRGLLFKPAEAATKSVKNDDWNEYQIKCEGSKVTHTLNGVVSGELDDKDEAKRALEGIIALQYHAPGGFEIRYKDVRIKLLEKK